MNFKSICVYAGSNSGTRPIYVEEARALGRYLAQNDIRLIYGAGKVGLMGVVADAALTHGGEVVGIIPGHLAAQELAHSSLTELHTVDTMHVRKHTMAEFADAFIALPGGVGTTEELLEILTWLQLGLHVKPVGILNVGDYYHSLLDFLQHSVNERFLRQEHLDMLCVAPTAAELMEKFRTFIPPRHDKWLG
jgi:uncharacterized protein (TIGR00730 family)